MRINKDVVLNEKINSHFLSEKQYPMKINAGINLRCGKNWSGELRNGEDKQVLCRCFLCFVIIITMRRRRITMIKQ